MKYAVTCPCCGHTFPTGWVQWSDNEETDEQVVQRYFDVCPECDCQFVTTCTYELVRTETEEVE